MPTTTRKGVAVRSHAQVAVPVPVRRLFTYGVTAEQHEILERIGAGARVRVSFGPRAVTGTVVEWPATAPGEDVEVRPLDEVLEHAPRLSPEVDEMARFISDYYLTSLGEAIETALPPDAAPRPEPVVSRAPGASLDDVPVRAKAQRRVFERLPADGGSLPTSGWSRADKTALRALVERGLAVAGVRRPDPPRPFRLAGDANGTGAKPHDPTPGQAAVLAQIEAALATGEYATQLLFGATGSGKTEVYFRAARAALDRGRSVIYLVPEIGLTPLLLDKVAARFPEGVVVLHSGLSARERYAGWAALRDGHARFVVGTRSAVFAPVADLGLIVVDEEQDGSYKQGETPRYNARDLAVFRAARANAVALLGSATPSMESFRHAEAGRYELLRLGARVVNRPLPEVLLVDMRVEFERRGGVTPLSETLAIALRDTVGRGEQALVLRNRRGWAAAVFCAVCGERVQCPRCSIALTWHQRESRLRCHYCEFETGWPQACPTCKSDDLKRFGEGTEQVEELIQRAVPDARVARMDRDVLRKKGAHEALLHRFDRGEIDILVGTQMIAKGHDFPRVTLVGIVSADHALGLPDFRAGERTFQLLTQVAGRAGRGERPGRVIAQAFQPEHPLLAFAVAQDYEAFYDREIGYRRALRYPPFAALVQILVLDKEEYRAREWADAVADALREAGGGRLMVAGPGPAPLERLRGQYRQQILVRTAGRRRLVAAVDAALTAIEGRVPRRAVHVDVDPYSVL